MSQEIARVIEKAIEKAIEKVLKSAIERVLERCLLCRLNELDLQLIQLDKIIRAFWFVSEDYCQRLTEKQIFQALTDYEKAEAEREKRFHAGYPGVPQRLL